MSSLCQHLADQGGVLLAAATFLLAVGSLGVALQRSPIHRQRAGEMAILCVLAGLILACLPLPRYRLPDCWPAGSAASGSPPLAEMVESPRPVVEPVDEPILAEATREAVRPISTDLLAPDFGAATDGGGVAVVMLPEPREPPTAAEPEPLPTSDVLPPGLYEDRQAAGGTGVTPVARKAESGTGVPPVAHRAAMTFDHRHWLSLAYVAGGLACLVWLALGRVLLTRMVWSARPPEPWLREEYQQIPFGRRRRPRLLISERCTRALSFGIWRPTILLPADACRADSAYSVDPSSDGPAWGGRGRASASPRDAGGLGADFVRPQPPVACRADRTEALRYVLLHELAHARQRDGWGHLLFNLAFPLLYFHPLYWWIRSRAYLAAELIADDWAAGRTAKESYVEVLIALAKGAGRRQLACVGSVRILGSRSQFYRRMQMLLDRETRLARRCSPRWRLIYPAACLLAVLLVVGTVGVRPVEAQSDEAAAPAAGTVAKPAAAGEQATQSEPASEPAADSKTEAVAQPPQPVPPGGKVVPLSSSNPQVLQMKINLMQLQKDELTKMLASMQATIAGLRKELDALKAERGPSQAAAAPGAAEPRRPLLQLEPLQPEGTPGGIHEPIGEGNRLVAVEVDPATGSKLLPGDRVSISAILRGVRVLSVRRDSGPDSAAKPVTVSLEVTPAQFDKLISVIEEGKLALRDWQILPRGTAVVVPPGVPAPPTLPTLSGLAPPSPAAPPAGAARPGGLPSPPRPGPPTTASIGFTTGSLGLAADTLVAGTEPSPSEGTQLDLVSLATSYVDAAAEREIAKLEYESRKQLAERNTIPAQELAIAEIKFKAAERKVALLRNIAEAALMETKADMDAAKGQLESVAKVRPDDRSAVRAAEAQVIRALSRLRVLESILASGGR